ncbi:helix-turn-helix transcriptional regulator [Fusobacterium animalis]|uniref:helix-turn-helix domain-containing protein n=1 Tax=Fusobacterium animalis TaxID=76859 RepID=UPI0030CDEEED
MNNIEIILRTLMKIHNFTQVELSIKTDIPLPTIRKYLKSEFNPTSKNIKKISENFEIDLSKLLKINLNNTEKLEDLELKYNLLLNKTLENIETYETDISLGDYGGHLSHLNYNPFDRLEDEEKNKRYFENTINFIKFLEKEINNRNEILDTDILKEFDKNIIEFLKSNGIILVDNGNILDENIKVKINNNTYEISNMKLKKIIEFLKNNLVNDFKNTIELIDKTIK